MAFRSLQLPWFIQTFACQPRTFSSRLPTTSLFRHKLQQQQRNFCSRTTPLFSHPIVQHRETANNRADMPFEFTEENKAEIAQILAKFPSNYKQSAIISLLYLVQEQNDNWVPLAAMNKVAQLLDVPPIRVYEVATFYTMFNRQPVGKHHLQVCGTTPCQLCGAEKIIERLEQHLDIKCGETTEDGLFTLSEVECLGACVNAPMMQINNKHFYEFLSEENVVSLVEKLRTHEQVKTNNQNHVFSCEGPQGQTTLKDPLPDHSKQCRDIDKIRADLAKQKEEAERKAREAQAQAAAKPPPKT